MKPRRALTLNLFKTLLFVIGMLIALKLPQAKAATTCASLFSEPEINIPPVPSNAQAAHETITFDLFNGKIVEIVPFSANGNKNAIYRIKVEARSPFSGKVRYREAILKPRYWGDGNGWNRTPNEYTAYFLNRLLKMDYIPPVAYRKGLNLWYGGQQINEGAFMFKVPNFTPLSKIKDRQITSNHDLVLSDNRVLNVLLQNPDGHYQNLGLGDHWVDGKRMPVFLDFGASLRVNEGLAMDRYKARGNSQPVFVIRRSTFEALKELSKNDFLPLIQNQFISKTERDQILTNRDDIIKYFLDLVSEAHKKGFGSNSVIIER